MLHLRSALFLATAAPHLRGYPIALARFVDSNGRHRAAPSPLFPKAQSAHSNVLSFPEHCEKL
jgi:hypothetical protein